MARLTWWLPSARSRNLGLEMVLDRYSRQVLLPEVGEEGQRKLLSATVALIGCGALGTAIASGLARSGVGHVKIIDRDLVELSNLQRQTLFDEKDVADGLPKAVAAADKLRRINSEIYIEPIVADLNPFNVEGIVGDVDLILDGTDNFEARFLINDASLKLGLPWVYGAVIATYGVTMTIVPYQTACLRCLMRDQPPPGTVPTCDTVGVLGPAASVIGALELTQGLKLLLGGGQEFWSHLTQVDPWIGDWFQVEIQRDPECPACQLNQYEFLEARQGSFVTTLCGRDAIQISVRGDQQLSLPQLAERLVSSGAVQFNEYLLRCKVEGYELTVFPNGRAIISGTSDESVARSLYAKYIGL
jgi:molybdopterin/thiamine biosynthesis adenylyltransferase